MRELLKRILIPIYRVPDHSSGHSFETNYWLNSDEIFSEAPVDWGRCRNRVFFWQKDHRFTSQTPPLAESVSTTAMPTASIPPTRRHCASAIAVSKLSDPLAHTKALLRSKLHQWQESEASDPDDDEGRAQLLQEMLAMVTDENVAEIIHHCPLKK